MNDVIITDPARRHDFLLLFDVADGNPNGDPDAGNMPRVDPETGHGLVTDVCLKRKIRNFVALDKEGIDGYNIYVNDKGIYLNELHEKAFKEAGIEGKGKRQPFAEKLKGVAKLSATYYDVRMFGAVMSTGSGDKYANAGQLRGPMQLTFSRSVDPITSLDISITRLVKTDAGEKDTEGSGSVSGTMGRKAILPYALYVAKGFFTPSFAKQTGVTADDLAVVWRALEMMWDIDHSAARGMMACRGLYIFSHDNPLGNAPAHKLFDKLSITKKPEVESPRRFADYEVLLTGDLPGGVTLTPQVEG